MRASGAKSSRSKIRRVNPDTSSTCNNTIHIAYLSYFITQPQSGCLNIFSPSPAFLQERQPYFMVLAQILRELPLYCKTQDIMTAGLELPLHSAI